MWPAWINAIGESAGRIYTYPLVTAAGPREDFNVAYCYVENSGEKSYQPRVGFAFNWRCAQAYLELISVYAGDFVPACTWLDTNVQNQRPIFPAVA